MDMDAVPAQRDPGQPRQRDGFALDVSSEPDRLVVAVRGELDLYTVPPLRSLLYGASVYPVSEVCVDFTACSFFDGATVGVLVLSARRLRLSGRQLSIRGLSATQVAVVQLCGLPKIVRVN